MNRRKLLALALALALCAGVLSGCGGSGAQDPAPNPGTQAPGDPSKTTLTVAIGNDISSIDPAGHNDTFSALVTNMLTSRLFTYDAAGNVIADAADTWSYETDTELVITIKKGITFQDGSEMKAEDVKASLDRAMESPNVAYVLDKIDHIEVVDDYTVKIVTQAPFAPLISNMVHSGCAILSKAQIDSGDFTAINGSGPYKFVEHQPGDHITLGRYDGYFDQEKASAFQTLLIRIIPESTSRTIALETGEVDLVTTLDTVDYSRVQDNPNLTLIETVANNINYVALNTVSGPFADRTLRQMMNYALDKQSILVVAENGHGQILDSFTPSGVLGYVPNDTYGYNPEKARELLAQAGYGPGELTVTISSYGTDRVSPVIQSNLNDIGVNCIVNNMDIGAFMDLMYSGGHDCCLIGFTTSSDPDRFFSALLGTGSMNNVSYFSDPEIDALIAQGASTIDEAERAGYYGQIHRLGMEAAPWVPLYSRVLIMGGSSKLSFDGVLDPMGDVNFNLIRIK